MPSDRQCITARQITGYKTSDADINAQYGIVDRSDKFLMANTIEKLLKKYNVTFEEGWDVIKDEIEAIAIDYLVDAPTAYCLYKDWKISH